MKNSLLVNIDGREKSVLAEIIEKKIWFKIDEHIYSYDLLELVDNFSKKTGSLAKSADRIIAPMPGKITKIFVSEQQYVNKGDVLLVMEAMKMEYTLKSDLNGTVEKLSVRLSDQVTLGQLLVQLKEKNV